MVTRYPSPATCLTILDFSFIFIPGLSLRNTLYPFFHQCFFFFFISFSVLSDGMENVKRLAPPHLELVQLAFAVPSDRTLNTVASSIPSSHIYLVLRLLSVFELS